ncbi:MAG TPA: O-methyltransferase [Nitrospiria bacterium]|nr:O-methyltransferase [Nitrospiria bacterium]
MDIIHPDIEDYLTRILPPRDGILTEMERLAEKQRFPIVGPLVGRLLSQMARMIGARRVFEFGSGFGYSAYWFLKGMDGLGRVVYTDDEEDNARLARDFFQRAGLLSGLQIEVGDALEIVDRQQDAFDIILIDCEKARYPMAFEKAVPRIRKGGLLIADNVLWSGSVVKESDDPSVRGIREFNRRIFSDPQLSATILPLRDGVSIGLKL